MVQAVVKVTVGSGYQTPGALGPRSDRTPFRCVPTQISYYCQTSMGQVQKRNKGLHLVIVI